MVSAFWKADTRIISHSNGWLFENQPLKRLIHDSSAIPKAKDCQPYQRLTRVQSAFSKADQRQVSLMKGWQNWFLEIEKYNWSAIEKADICGQPYERLTGNFSKSQPFQRLTWWSAIEQRSRECMLPSQYMNSLHNQYIKTPIITKTTDMSDVFMIILSTENTNRVSMPA